MSKHTPGPWAISEGAYGMQTAVSWLYDDRDRCDSGEYSGEKCWIDTDKDGAPYFMGPDPHAEANARLIAAAPDLLEAVEYIVNWSDDKGKWNPETARDLCRAAIAKATGGN